MSYGRPAGSSVDALEGYLANLTKTLEGVPGLELSGVYVGGSYALGGYEPGRSDVDVAAVARVPTTAEVKRAIVDAVRHEALPCPARGLELVVYPLAAIQVARADAAFDLNLNTGRAMPFRFDVTPVPGDDHWFAIDRSILGRHGATLLGPPAEQTFAPIPHGMLLPLLVESLRRHARGDVRADDAVLNACRALRFALDDVWSTKTDAGRWAIEHGREALVQAALDARAGNGELEPAAVERFIAGVSEEIEEAARSRR